VEHYHTDFSEATATGTGKIKLSSYSNIEVGDGLLLGPSSDVTNLNAVETVDVTSISGGYAYIDATASGAPPYNEYAIGDKVSVTKYIYLFSDTGQNGSSTKGSIYKLDLDGNVIEVNDSGIYKDVRGSAWSIDYEYVGFVKNSNLLYVDPYESYQVKKSHALTNIESNDVTIIPVYGLIFDSNTIYRLQNKITLRDDSGGRSTTTWSTYNYHQDTISPYTNSIVMYISPDGIFMNQEQNVTLTAIVRDQFGVGLSGKTVTFEENGSSYGAFTPIDGQVTTDSNGVATIRYDLNFYTPTATTGGDIEFRVKVDGSSSMTGSQYVWSEAPAEFKVSFLMDGMYITQMPTFSGGMPGPGSDLYNEVYLKQIDDVEIQMYIKSLSKFQFPGGHWSDSGAPSDSTTSIVQLDNFYSDLVVPAIDDDFTNVVPLKQLKNKTNDKQLSQTHVSRHITGAHQDDAEIDQFIHVVDAIPAFWSKKNPISTNIWIRLRPFGFDLNQSSLVFRVKEVSYAGDTGYIDVTNRCVVTTFDAGGGLIGLDILYNPVNDFHHNGVVFVSIEVYDGAPNPNIILSDYWFTIIPDYKAPYIENEFPAREEEEVSTNTSISFDIKDAGVGVDIDSLEFFINNQTVSYTTSQITGGYHVEWVDNKDFYYGQTVELSVKVKDGSDNQNVLYDTWRFYCAGSTGPWIDHDSFIPRNCTKGVVRNYRPIEFNVYAINDTGLDRDSIIVNIGGKDRNITITPIIYRIS